mgnify:FL=1
MTIEQLNLALTDCVLNCAECKANHNVCDKDNCKNEIKRQALERLLPKRVIRIEFEPIFINFQCPTCERHLTTLNNNAKVPFLDRKNCCDYCGQALDWSDVND